MHADPCILLKTLLHKLSQFINGVGVAMNHTDALWHNTLAVRT